MVHAKTKSLKSKSLILTILMFIELCTHSNRYFNLVKKVRPLGAPYIYIYIYIYMCVCVSVSVYVFMCTYDTDSLGEPA